MDRGGAGRRGGHRAAAGDAIEDVRLVPLLGQRACFAGQGSTPHESVLTPYSNSDPGAHGGLPLHLTHHLPASGCSSQRATSCLEVGVGAEAAPSLTLSLSLSLSLSDAYRSPLVDVLHLYDVVNTPGVAADLSHVDSGAEVGFSHSIQ